jgi:peptidoglycan/LPS O-acetylase OafA/YrhL
VVGPQLPGLAQYIFTGHPAVITFFVISGFCIHTPYLNKEMQPKAFWLSLLIRILVPVMVSIPLAYALNMKQYNFTDGYILWSVVCELWYYALYPALSLASRYVPFSVQWKIMLPISLLAAVAMGSDANGGANIYGPWLNWFIALPSWLIGCALAEQKHTGNVVVLRFVTAITASVLYWATIHTSAGFYLTMNFFAILVAAWISAEIAAARTESILDKIGKWSYSIYLFHAIAWTAVGLIIRVNSIYLLPAILALCYVFYRVVEKPSHLIARKIYNRYVATATI